MSLVICFLFDCFKGRHCAIKLALFGMQMKLPLQPDCTLHPFESWLPLDPDLDLVELPSLVSQCTM